MGFAGHRHSPEAREKISRAQRGKAKSPEHREALREAAGRPERREKIRQAQMGRQRSSETRGKMSEALRQRYANPEERDRVRQAALGRSPSPETREKLRQANVGKRPSAETREKIRQAALGRSPLPETREKLRQGQLRQPPKKMTDIERMLAEELTRRRLTFKRDWAMFERFRVDFVLPQAQLIIEADGWQHCRARMRARDAALDETARLAGWTVFHFPHKDIKQDPGAIGRAVAAFVHRAENAAAAPS